jgi:uncharacterized caspase-like protein
LQTQEYQKKALIIAISDYVSMNPLEFCKNDGNAMYNMLTSKPVGFDRDSRKLIGQVSYETLRNAIYDFFDPDNSTADDIMLFYYSGHGVPGAGGIYIASSEIDPNHPNRKGFSFFELTNEINSSSSMRMVTILDCCHSGTLNLAAKGDENARARVAKETIDEESRNIQQGQGKFILAASQGYQEAYRLQEKGHSIFTYFLLEGLRGNENSLDIYGYVTPESLTKYISREVRNLPDEKRLNQTPVMKSEASGDVILASYPELRPALSHKVDQLKPNVNLIVKRLNEREKYLQRNADKTKKEIGYDPFKSPAAYVPVPDLYLGILSCNAVCRIQLDYPVATGFMISPSLMLTMDYVIPDIATASTASLDFNFEDDIDEGEGNIKTFSLKPKQFFYTIGKLYTDTHRLAHGITIVAVNPVAKDGTSISSFGYLPLAENVLPVLNESLSLIHQPMGLRKYLSFKNLIVVEISEKQGALKYKPRVASDVIEEPGSAGGPVLNSRWQLVGVHSFDEKKKNLSGGILARSVYNYLVSVRKKLPARQKEILNELFSD